MTIEKLIEHETHSTLNHARMQLSAGLANPKLSTEGYAILMTRYVNAIQAKFFDPSTQRCFADYSDVARLLWYEMDALVPQPSICILDIQHTLEYFLKDDRGTWLYEQNLPVLPRAVVHTLFDLIDGLRPINPC